MPKFEVVSPYQPSGDQPEAIDALAAGIENGLKEQVLLGVTGSGKTYTMAKVIEKVQRPTLVLAHNKTLAAQLCAEFKEFFPNNAVEYFVSYYDYYQPEAYIPHTDTYIAKDASTNDEIDRLRLSATCALLERRDVIVVSSVSCIYGLGEPDDFAQMVISLRQGAEWDRDELLRRLVENRYERNDVAFERNRFRVRGDTVEIYPAYYKDHAIRVEFFGDEIDRISDFHPLTGTVNRVLNHVAIYPASHYVTTKEKMDRALGQIRTELEDQVKYFNDNEMLVEAQRIRQRTEYDMEMMRELGYCSGIENYSRIISDRPAGSAPMTLLDFFPDDFLLFVDESHVTLPQVRAMYNGDRARKESLVRYGFRLPCAFDNRPLKFEEFESRIGQAVFVSATPGPYERERADNIVEQVIRPTGLLDPRVEVRPVEGPDRRPYGGNPGPGPAERAGVGHYPYQEDGGGSDGVFPGRQYPGAVYARRRSRPSSGWRSSGICGWASLTCWWVSTCCGRVWICRRSLWWRYWTPTRRASSAARRPLSRPSAGRPGTPRVWSSSTPIPLRPPCGRPWTKRSAAGKFRTLTTRPTASCRRPSSRMSGKFWRSPRQRRTAGHKA